MQVKISHISCGIRLLYGLDIGYFREIIKDPPITSNSVPDVGGLLPTAFIKDWTYLFSDNKHGDGTSIANYIKEHELGELYEHGWWINPNTSTKINLWIWKYNGKKPKILRATKAVSL